MGGAKMRSLMSSAERRPRFRGAAGLVGACLAATSLAQPELNFLRSGQPSETQVKSTLSTELEVAREGPQPFSDVSNRLQEISKSLSTMYRSLPKDYSGKLTHQAVRYALHRYFMRHHGWFVRGLEPRNDTWSGSPNPGRHNSSAMKEWVPSYLQDILEQATLQQYASDEVAAAHLGTDLNELSALAATIQDLIWSESNERLGTAYDMYGFPRMKRLTRVDAGSIMRTYYIAFLNSWDFTAGTQDEAERNVQEFITDYEGWPDAKRWLGDLAATSLRPEGDGMFLFEGLTPVVSRVGEEYYELNDRECDDLKDTLKGLQGRRAGRVRLSAFYHKGMYSHWEFSEKKEYLRRLGVLDESDPQHPSVIIANYAMARPNCLEASNLYAICCRNQCEDLMGTLERHVEGAMAEEKDIIAMISGLGSASVQAPRVLAPELQSRLSEIAELHGGRVPLHGRLFAQFMHHAYPLECPYPHELGAAYPLTRSEWIRESGEASAHASLREMTEHIARDACHIDAGGGVQCSEEDDASLPWSSNEELVAQGPDPQGALHRVVMLVIFLAVAGLVALCAVAVVFIVHTRRRRVTNESPRDQDHRDPLE